MNVKIVICENYHGNGTYIILYQKLEKSSENGEDERKSNCAAYWQIYYILYPSLYKPFKQLITNTDFFERISPKACLGDRSVNRAQPLYIANDIFGSCWSSI